MNLVNVDLILLGQRDVDGRDGIPVSNNPTRPVENGCDKRLPGSPEPV